MRKLALLLCLAYVPLAHADEKSAKATATELMNLVQSPAVMKGAFKTSIGPILQQMRQQGLPDEGVKEAEGVLSTWFDQEMKWEEIQPKVIEIYLSKFTEAELNDLLKFYKSPTGQKAITQLPALMQESSAVGQQYAQSKQASLMSKLQPVLQKYMNKKP